MLVRGGGVMEGAKGDPEMLRKIEICELAHLSSPSSPPPRHTHTHTHTQQCEVRISILEPDCWDGTLSSLLASCVTSGKLLHLSVPWFLHLPNGNHNNTCLTGHGDI